MRHFPSVNMAYGVVGKSKRLYIGAYGFEDRSLGWCTLQSKQGGNINDAIIFHYKNPKGRNKVEELRELLNLIGVSYPDEIDYDIYSQHNIELNIEKKFKKYVNNYDEIIIDITAMTKFLILLTLCNITKFKGCVRIVYSEAKNYAPSVATYRAAKTKMEALARFPSRGFETILRAKCLSSIRMQGQPVALVAFTSFNEQLVRHMLGTISPHLLLFINGRPPSSEYKWREIATQEIHSKLIEEYPIGNTVDGNNLLKRFASSLDYIDTIERIEEIYQKYRLTERIILAATGSKMQTVGVFFCKIRHPDIHIEYPTPDSYFQQGMSTGTKFVYEIKIDRFSELIRLEAYKETY